MNAQASANRTFTGLLDVILWASHKSQIGDSPEGIFLETAKMGVKNFVSAKKLEHTSIAAEKAVVLSNRYPGVTRTSGNEPSVFWPPSR